MKIGIFGGTFDPIHKIHLHIAKISFEILELDKLIFLPTGNPPHKDNKKVTAFAHRIKMVELAIANIKNFIVSDFENRENLTKSYTSDTLDEFNREFPNDEIFFIVGSDSLFDIENWKNPQNIFDKATMVVFNRPNTSSFDELNVQIKYLERKYFARIRLIDIFSQDMSSTDIRLDLQDGHLSKNVVEPSVLQYIKDNKLYEK